MPGRRRQPSPSSLCTTYVFHWPLLLGLTGLGLTSATRSQPEEAIPWGGWLLLVSAAISALLLWVPFIYENGKRALSLHLAPLQQERLVVHLNPEPKRLVIRRSDDSGSAKTFSLVNDGRWAYLRFDASPPAGLDLEMDILSDEPVEIRLAGVSTGLPSFPGIVTQPPGLTISPPDYGLDIPTDFTVVHRRILLPVVRGTNE